MEVKFLDDLSTVEIPSEYDNRIAEDSANHYCVRWCGVAGDYGTLPLLSAEGADATQARAGAISKARPPARSRARKSVVEGKSVSIRVDLGCLRIIKKKKNNSVTS